MRNQLCKKFGVDLTAARIEMGVLEGFGACRVVGEEVLMFESVLGMMKEEIFGKNFEMAVAVGAFAGLEVVAFGQIETATGRPFLEIVAAEIVLYDDALQSGLNPVPVIDGIGNEIGLGLVREMA